MIHFAGRRSYLCLAFVHFLGLGCPQVSKDTKLTQQILSEVGHKICTVEKCGFISEDALDICSRTKLAFFAADKHWVDGLSDLWVTTPMSFSWLTFVTFEPFM